MEAEVLSPLAPQRPALEQWGYQNYDRWLRVI